MGCIKCQKSIAGDESRAYGLNKTGEWHAAHADCIQLLEKFNGIEFVEYYNPGLFTKLI